MSNPNCCVCNAPIEGTVRSLQGRYFCSRHYEHLNRDRRGMWAAVLALILGLVVFVVGVFALAPVLRPWLRGDALALVGTILALIPAALWLAIFYVQDRLEPEPKAYVLAVFVLGLLLASAIGQPLINDFFRVNAWATDSLWLRLAVGILIVGALQEFLKYAAVRYTIFNSPEYDERIDGIVYGAAAGLGYATWLNVAYVVSNGGVDLGTGAVRIAVTALAQASFAGVVGYFLGRAKFENRGPFWLPAGLLLAAILNGVVTTALGVVSRAGLQSTPLRGLILAAAVAAATFGLLFAIMRRSSQVIATASASQA